MKTENFTALRRKETLQATNLVFASSGLQEYTKKSGNVNMIKRKYVCMLTDEFYHDIMCSLNRT